MKILHNFLNKIKEKITIHRKKKMYRSITKDIEESKKHSHTKTKENELSPTKKNIY